jgi:branched-chain amino acid transport system substrate-binding protein
VVADALERAKRLTPKDVREALARTSMMTAFGPVKFTSYDKKTQQNSLPSYLAQWQEGVLAQLPHSTDRNLVFTAS